MDVAHALVDSARAPRLESPRALPSIATPRTAGRSGVPSSDVSRAVTPRKVTTVFV
jgi:hypothetical protein